jgi:hypothetical protein
MGPSFTELDSGERRSRRPRSRALAIGGALLCAAWLAGCGGGGGGDGDDASDGADGDDAGDGGDGDDAGDDGDDAGDDAGDDGGDGGDGGEVSYTADIRPIFEDKCVYCHHADSASEVDLTSPFGPQGLIERPNSWKGSSFTLLVDPGNPDNSFILHKVSETSLDPEVEGQPMPIQIPPLSEAEIDVVANWIDTGAQDGGPYNPVATIFGTDPLSLGVEAGSCTWCHYPGSETRLDVTDPLDPVFGLVDVNAAVGGVRVIPNEPENSILITKLEGADEGPQMPYNPARLSSGEIAALTQWIADGAPEN